MGKVGVSLSIEGAGGSCGEGLLRRVLLGTALIQAGGDCCWSHTHPGKWGLLLGAALIQASGEYSITFLTCVLVDGGTGFGREGVRR